MIPDAFKILKNYLSNKYDRTQLLTLCKLRSRKLIQYRLCSKTVLVSGPRSSSHYSYRFRHVSSAFLMQFCHTQITYIKWSLQFLIHGKLIRFATNIIIKSYDKLYIYKNALSFPGHDNFKSKKTKQYMVDTVKTEWDSAVKTWNPAWSHQIQNLQLHNCSSGIGNATISRNRHKCYTMALLLHYSGLLEVS